MNKYMTAIAALLVFVGCASKEPTTPDPQPGATATKVEAPSEITLSREGKAVVVSWKDNSDNESGFAIYSKKEGQELPVVLGLANKDVTSFRVGDQVKVGKSYYFGVCAKSPMKESLNSDIVYSELYYVEDVDPSVVLWTEDPQSTYASVVLSYEAKDFESEITEMGLCWSENADPTIEDAHLASSLYVEGAQRQSIPSVVLKDGQTYHFRAYATTAEKTYYSKDASSALAPQPEAITFTWTDITPSGYPSEVKAYKTSSTMDGSPINAWYVIADISTGKVGLRANSPGGCKTLNDQWRSDCLAMINAGYFYGTNAVGLSIIEGVVKTTLTTVRGTLRSSGSDISAEYNTMYNVTRAAFGVTADGVAKAVFNYQKDHYDAPLPNLVGDQKYEDPFRSWRSHKIAWSPEYAIGAGPMLVYDGKIMPEMSESPRGAEYYINNNELIPYDIYGVGVTPDRTAIGRTADGKIVFFVCDGRIKGSDGATIVETALIMKGLGCVEAVNMDGGGSTAMHLTTGRVNSLEKNTAGDTENRPVATTWCIYKK